MSFVLPFNLDMEQGCDWPAPGDEGSSFTWEAGATEAIAVAVDLTGYTAVMKIRAEPADTVLLTLTNGAGITLGGVAGTIVLAVTSAQTASLPAGLHLFDLLLTSSGGIVTKFLSGSVQVNPTISVA